MTPSLDELEALRRAERLIEETAPRSCCRTHLHWDEQVKLCRALIAAAREGERMRLYAVALADGWTVEKASLYDEEGVEGWLWSDATGAHEYSEIGGWDELPSMPDEVRAILVRSALAKETQV